MKTVSPTVRATPEQPMKSAQHWRSKYLAERAAHKRTKATSNDWRDESLRRLHKIQRLRKKAQKFADEI